MASLERDLRTALTAKNPSVRKIQYMADKPVAPKSEHIEKALTKLFGQMNKDVNKREWTPACFAALVTYVAEQTGAVWPGNKEESAAKRTAFRTALLDGDMAYSSNMKKYAQSRGFLPAKLEAQASAFE